MGDLHETVAALARRVQALEDELAIHRLIVRYGLAVDIGDADGAADVFTEDGVYDVDVGLMRGRKAVAAMVRGERHQSMVGRCAHQIGPARDFGQQFWNIGRIILQIAVDRHNRGAVGGL